MSFDYNYLTCRELIQKYPSVQLWGWNAVKIGVFYNCLLLDGRKFGKNSQTIIIEASFLKLIEFVEQGALIIESEPEYANYQNVLDSFVQSVMYRWSPSAIGLFRHSGLLKGKRSHKEGANMVTLQSVERLIEFTNQRFYNIAHSTK